MHGIETNINSSITSSPYHACTSTRLVFASRCTSVIGSLIPRPIPIYISWFVPAWYPPNTDIDSLKRSSMNYDEQHIDLGHQVQV
jgi:hypothetical protein